MSYLVYFSILLGTMITFLRLLTLVLPAHPAQLLSFYLFTFASFALLLVCSFYGVIASIFLRCVGYGGCSQWTTGRAFKWSMWLFTGVSFNVTGSMKREGGLTGEDALTERPAVFVGNHQSELDVLMLGTMFPQWCSVTAKSSLKWTPFLGWFMALSKTVFIDRANRATARAAFDSAAHTMNTSRQSVFIFPEGTRSYATEPMLLPFKKGAFHLAIQAQVPVIPVVAANYDNVLNVKERRIRPGAIDVTVLPPIQTKGMTTADVDALVERTRKAMMDELVRLQHVEAESNGTPFPRASGVDAARSELRRRN